MHVLPTIIATFGFLAATGAAPAAVPVPAIEIKSSPANALAERQSYFTLTSFLTSTCGTTRGYDRFYRNICSKLDFPAKSIRFQLSTIPSGCVLYGYSGVYCDGFNNLFIVGPTTHEQCYKTLPSASTEEQTTIRSVKLVC